MGRLSALSTGCLYPPGNIPCTYFCQRLSRLQGHNEAGRFESKNSSDTITNRTRDLPACSTVPQTTARPASRTVGALHEDQYTFLSNLGQFFLEWKMFQTDILEKIKHTFHVQKLKKKNLALFQIMKKNIVELTGHR